MTTASERVARLRAAGLVPDRERRRPSRHPSGPAHGLVSAEDAPVVVSDLPAEFVDREDS